MKGIDPLHTPGADLYVILGLWCTEAQQKLQIMVLGVLLDLSSLEENVHDIGRSKSGLSFMPLWYFFFVLAGPIGLVYGKKWIRGKARLS